LINFSPTSVKRTRIP